MATQSEQQIAYSKEPEPDMNLVKKYKQDILLGIPVVVFGNTTSSSNKPTNVAVSNESQTSKQKTKDQKSETKKRKEIEKPDETNVTKVATTKPKVVDEFEFSSQIESTRPKKRKKINTNFNNVQTDELSTQQIRQYEAICSQVQAPEVSQRLNFSMEGDEDDEEESLSQKEFDVNVDGLMSSITEKLASDVEKFKD